MNLLHWWIFIGAALLEVCGDALIRKGLRGGGAALMIGGALALAAYGFLVNMVRWDFARMLGVYVAVFATVSVLFGRFVFGENVPAATWIGLAVIIFGAMIIQIGGGR